jgi:Domain of unknown function (DUF1083).
MKKITAIALVVIMALAFSVSVLAVDPGYTYEAAKLTNAVTVDGKVNGAEWDDAVALVIDADNAVFQEYGRWQGGGNNKTAAELSVTVKMKWDDKNLYILEQRKDTNFIKGGTDTAATEPWCGDGTLFFLAFNESDDYTWQDAYQPFWAMAEDGKMSFALRSWISGTFSTLQEDMDNWKTGGAYDDGTKTLTVELVIPFADIGYMSDSTKAAVGTKLRFTPIYANIDVASDYKLMSGSWDQMNFHDMVANGEADLTENSNGTEIPVNWAGIVLTDVLAKPAEAAPAPSAEIAEEAPAEVAPAEEAPAVTAAPETMDMTVVILLAAVAATALFAVSKKRAR